MRMRATKERRQLRDEFCYKWRHEIQVFKLLYRVNPDEEKVRKFIEQHAREELEYNDKTHWKTIFSTLRRNYMRIFDTDF